MKIDAFKSSIKGLKKGGYTSDVCRSLTITRIVDTEKLRLQRKDECSKCNHVHTDVLYVDFVEHKRLTIFEAGMLFSVFVDKKLPVDYGAFHECVAGQRFIKNIKDMEVLNL